MSWILSGCENEMEGRDNVAMHDEAHLAQEGPVQPHGEIGERLLELPARERDVVHVFQSRNDGGGGCAIGTVGGTDMGTYMKNTTGSGIAVVVCTGTDLGRVESPILERGTRSWDLNVERVML